jgi:hypothetical protein
VPCEPEVYDLIVDLQDGLKRVQVKSTTSHDARGNWTARIGHRPDGSPKSADFIPYGVDELDLFLIVDGDLLLYLIPATAVEGKTTLSLRGYREFIVADAGSFMDSINSTLGSPVHRLRTAG